jgi:hypothetical protein
MVSITRKLWLARPRPYVKCETRGTAATINTDGNLIKLHILALDIKIA